jgi:CHAT domain-containing protein
MTDHSRNLGYRTLALLYAQDGQLDEALRVAELARDRRLRDRFFERARDGRQLPPPVRRRLHALTAEIQALDGRLALEADIVERVKLESRRTLAVAARDEVQRQAEPEADRPGAGGPPRFELPTLGQLRARLDEHTALASIHLSSDHGWAVVVERAAPVRFLTLDHEPDLDVAIRAWVGLLGGAPLRAWPVANGGLVVGYERPAGALGHYLSAQALAERVSRALQRPLLAAAPKAQRLVIVGDDELNGVPFGALPLDGGAVAVDRLEVSYAPSLATYAALSGAGTRRSWARDLLSFAADGGAEAASRPRERADGPAHGDPTALMLEYASAHPLPFAWREVEAASGNFAPARTTVVRGAQASKANLARASDDGSLSQYRYVHIAAHGFSLPLEPERSTLILNGPAAAGPDSRVLTAAELANLKMGSELLVLAACRTGVGRYEPGQGPLGFAFAALAAGNQAAVLSLWEVADDLTHRFMSGLFERLKRGLGPSAALAATQREFAHDPDPRVNSASTWAAFVLYGRS